MNCGAGSVVYVAGEVVVQSSSRTGTDANLPTNSIKSNDLTTTSSVSEPKYYNFQQTRSLDWNRIAQIGVLGTVENGFFMSFW